MKKTNKRRAVVKGVAALLFIAAVLIAAAVFIVKFIDGNNYILALISKETTGGTAANTTQYGSLEKQLAYQAETDEMLLAELASGYYTPEEPLVVVNPYNISPLSALALFQTEEPAQISVHIPGTIELTAVDYTFDGYLTDHIIPIYGLYASTKNQITLTVSNKNGTSEEIPLTIKTEKLDSALNDLIITTSLNQPDKYSPGFNLCYRIGYPFKSLLAFDAQGEIRMQLKSALLGDMTYHEQLMDYNGHFLQVINTNAATYTFIELDALGRIYRAVSFHMGDVHHDLLSLGDGSRLLALFTSTDSIVIEDMIAELDMTTGEVIKIMDLKNVLQVSRNPSPSVDIGKDVFHVNTIVGIEDSDDIIISVRNQNQIVRLSWPDGEIKWIAGDPTNVLPMFKEYYLTPIGDNFSYFYRQHAPHIMMDLDNDPSTIDLLVFDNGTTRSEFDDSVSVDDLYSRMVHYRIDEVNMTIELIREYGQEFGHALYSAARGDADELPNLNWLGVFDVTVKSSLMSNAPTYVEIDQNNELVWTMQVLRIKETSAVTDLYEYRVERQSLYNDAANDLQLDVEPLVILKD